MKVICPHCKETVELPNEAYNEMISCPLCSKNFLPSKEIAKTFPSIDDLLKKPEFVESLKNDIAEANQNISHADFVAGVQKGEMGIKCVFGEPSQFIKGTARQIVFMVLVSLYMIAPLIFVSLWAWHEKNWWLLIGILISFIGTRVAASLIYNQERQYSVGAFLLIALVVTWSCFGIHRSYTFFAASALWGLMLFMMADNVEKEYALQSLAENPELFKSAIAQNKIMIVRKNN